MTISGLNIIGLIIAVVVSFVSGGIWFGPKTFYPVWMKARGIESGQLETNRYNIATLMGTTLIGISIQTTILGVVITSLQRHDSHFKTMDGALLGAMLGVGIAAFASLSHRLFGGETFKSWLIETANDAINLTIAGAIIAFLN